MQSVSQPTNQKGMSTPRFIDIELLALDLNSCTRCVGTLSNMEKAIDMVRPILDIMQVQVNVKKTVVESEDQARQLAFVTSPTVRINGHDITFETIESKCDSCTDLCGCEEGTSCRVWNYQGKDFTEAPVGLIVESMLRMIFPNNREPWGGKAPDFIDVPENLQRFFQGKSLMQAQTSPCCSPAEQESCCSPDQKLSCCETPDTETCGCR